MATKKFKSLRFKNFMMNWLVMMAQSPSFRRGIRDMFKSSGSHRHTFEL
jgi:hypothetical protein